MKALPTFILLLFISIVSTAKSAEAKSELSPVFIQPDGKNIVGNTTINNVDPDVQSIHFNIEG